MENEKISKMTRKKIKISNIEKKFDISSSCKFFHFYGFYTYRYHLLSPPHHNTRDLISCFKHAYASPLESTYDIFSYNIMLMVTKTRLLFLV